MAKTHLDWLELDNNSADPTDTDSTRGGFAIVSGSPKYWDGSSWSAFAGANVNGEELEDVAGTNGTYGVPITLVGVLAGSGNVNIFNANAPFKFRVLDAWAVETKAANSGDWKITDGTDDITTAVSFGTSDKDLTRADAVDDAKHEIAASGTLTVVASEGTDEAIVYVQVMKITA